MPAGRPSTYSPEIADAICARLIEGESLRAICAEAAMPGRMTVLDWLGRESDFRAKYQDARASQADLMDDLILETAHAASPETANADRVRIMAYQWRASRLAPKRYGDRVTAEHVGKDGGPIETTNDTPAKLAQALLGMLHAAGAQESGE